MISPISSSPQVYAVYFRENRRSSFADVRCIQAASKEQARSIGEEAVAKAFPNGCVIAVCLAKDSPYPIRDANGNWGPPSKFFPKPNA